MRTPTTGSTEPGYCRARNGGSRSGCEVSARPRSTAPPGSGTESCFRAGFGAGFRFSGRIQTEAIQIKARSAAKLLEIGRDADTFGFESIQQYSRGDNQWPGDIAAWRVAGGSHISVVTMGANLTTVDGH